MGAAVTTGCAANSMSVGVSVGWTGWAQPAGEPHSVEWYRGGVALTSPLAVRIWPPWPLRQQQQTGSFQRQDLIVYGLFRALSWRMHVDSAALCGSFSGPN